MPPLLPQPQAQPQALPLTPAEFAAALAAIGGFEARPLVAVATSGGPDSVALALLAERWARDQGGRATALIVDHGLRPESGAEAATVAGWLTAHGIAAAILRWQGMKPATGVQEAARDARYRLLAAWCRAHGVLHLLTAHHREDQAETYLIRRRAGSGVDGLAAMSAVRELLGCRLVRPLLAVPRERLKALLIAEGQPFVDDPSNRNPAFERARLRTAGALHPHPNPPPQAGEGRVGAGSLVAGSVEDLLQQTRACGRERVARELALDRLLAAAVGLHPGGFAAVDPDALAGAEPELVERLLARVAACIGVARYPARRDRVARLRAALLADPERARTLGGCRFVPWRGRILVLREQAAAEPPRRLEPGRTLLWDQRFAVGPAPGAGDVLVFGYLGSDAAPARQSAAPLAGGLPRLVYPVLPALRDATGLVAVPHLGWRRDGHQGALPSVSFWSANPLTRAAFTVV